MNGANIPHLCGGIFFGLLLETMKPRSKARDMLNGGTDGLTANNLYNALIEVVTGESISSKGNTYSKSVSNYKNCVSSKGAYVPFTDSITRSTFDTKFNEDSTELIKRVSVLVDKYLNKDKCEWLVRALIDIMQIEQLNVDVFVNYTDKLSVRELDNVDTIYFIPFFLSVLDYIIVNCPDCESGRPTFEAWYKQSGTRGKWEFKSNIGKGIKHINVLFDVLEPSKLITYEYVDYPDNEVENNEEIANKAKVENNFFNCFKEEFDCVLKYLIDTDPCAETIYIGIYDEIDRLLMKWEFDVMKISSFEERKLAQDIIQNILSYKYYISDIFLKPINNKYLYVRNSTDDETRRLYDELMPKSFELRNNMCELYKRLWTTV
ncbi:hypothetical protein HMPREF9970_0711 [Lachnoanaerobaculum saburreum F0468]|jgi:hypothetical protein|uniref:Uncharacterized protein n=1 Tax=Lachnoanaerobaculum saburreum F0468 TaxID=1095750 RepID=I0RBE5_9FIRM|nr:hypothetical protein [Lachnoanaerobaculum saburreum]EIC97003.1 hypothetical protein HMPREF9970_0711 [Lachnoanaerobaculum saburreum F0468]